MKENQHYIPEFYLQYWSGNPNNKVWVYYKDSSKNPNPHGGNPQLVHPKNILKEDFLYSIEENQVIEDWLGKSESFIGEVFSKLSKNIALSEDDEQTIKAFSSLILSRHPRMKPFSEAFLLGGHSENPLAQTLPLRYKFSVFDKIKFHLYLEYISKELRPEWSFITSDTPVIIHRDKTTSSVYYTYPLSPYILAYLSPYKPKQKESIIQDIDVILKINKTIADYSDEIIIGNSAQIIEKTTT